MAPDWIENKTAALLAQARRSGYFADCIQDAKHLQAENGYQWDVALGIAVGYWTS